MLHRKFSDWELVAMAKGNALMMSYNRTSELRVGAALACKSEKDDGAYDVYFGASIILDEKGPNISAEINAGTKAIGDGNLWFCKIAVYSNDEDYKISADSLRFLKEFAVKGDMEVVTFDEYDDVVVNTLSELIERAEE